MGPRCHCHYPPRLPVAGAGGCFLAVAGLHHGVSHSVLGAPASLGDLGEPAERAGARLGGACQVEEGHGSSVPLNGEQGGRARQGQGVERDSPGQQPQLGCLPEPYWRNPASCSQHQKPRSHGPDAQANSGFAQNALSAGPAAPLLPGAPRIEIKESSEGGGTAFPTPSWRPSRLTRCSSSARLSATLCSSSRNSLSC